MVQSGVNFDKHNLGQPSIMPFNNGNSYTLPSHLDGDGRRLNQQHEVFRLITSSSLLGKPLPRTFSGSVLDVGTGTGIWATEFATEHPNCRVLGVDLFPPSISPEESTPKNCAFAVADAEKDEEWKAAVPSGSFDLVHTRMFLIQLRDAKSMLRRILDALKPGGRVEFQEKQDPYRTDDPDPAARDTPLLRHSLQRIEAAKLCGMDRTIAEKLAAWMEELGYQDVVVEERKIPIGDWMDEPDMKTAGEKFKECLEWGTMGISRTVFMNGFGWNEEQIKENVDGAVKDLGNGQVYAPILFITGTKPGKAE